MRDDTKAGTKRKQHEDTRISAYPHSLEEVLEKALRVPPPDGKKRRKRNSQQEKAQRGE